MNPIKRSFPPLILAFIILSMALLLTIDSAMGDSGAQLRKAAMKGDLDRVRVLLDSGIDVNAQSGAGEMALSHAARGGHVAVVKLLIERGADLDHALANCEVAVDWGKDNGNDSVLNEGRRCLSILKRIQTDRAEAKRQEQEAARIQAIEAQRALDMKKMLKEVIAETSKGQPGNTKSEALRSDIDKPEFTESQRIMGNDDLAVIIGIEGYQNLPKSDYSYDDAKLVKEYARALGFRERNIELLLDERATRSSLEKTLEIWLKNKAKANSRIFIYYSGHGAPDPVSGEAYLVPYDGDPSYLSVTGFSLNRLYKCLRRLPASEIVVVLDACFSGSGGRSVLAKGARPLVMTAEAPALGQNMVVLSATQGSQISTSSPDKGHGIFTYYFLKALKDGKKNISEIYEYLKPQVEDEAKSINVRQSPSLNPVPAKISKRFDLRR